MGLEIRDLGSQVIINDHLDLTELWVIGVHNVIKVKNLN